MVLFSFRLITDADLGFHLKGGQWILENHRFMTRDVYTYTRSGTDYVDIHWFYEVLLYLVYRMGGYGFLLLFNTGLIAAAFFITFKRLRLSGAPLWMCVFLLTATLFACEIRFQVKPEILSWVLLGLTLWVLEERANHQRDALFLLPILQLVWVNVEGLFPLGLVLMGFYILSSYCHGAQPDKKLFLFSGLAVVACLANPHFIQGAVFPFQLLSIIGTSNIFKQTIAEFQPSWFMPFSSALMPEVGLIFYRVFSFFLLLLLLATFRHRKIHEFLIAGSFFYLSGTSFRNIPLFMIATLPLAAICWKDLPWDRFQKTQKILFNKPIFAWGFAFLLLGMSLRIITNAYYISDRRLDRFGWGLDQEYLPVRAAEFLVQNQLDGKILNQIDAGGWLDWKGPQKVFIDGRTADVMGEDLYKEDMASFAPGGLKPLIEKYGFDIIFFNPISARQWIFELRKMQDWRLVYLDESVAIYLRNHYAPQIPLLNENQLLPERGIVFSSEEDLTLLEKPSPAVWKNFFEGFYRPAIFPRGLLSMALFNYHLENFRIAEPLFLECIRRSRGQYDDFYFEAGLMYFFAKKYDYSRICLTRVLEDDPRNSQAQRVFSYLPVR